MDGTVLIADDDRTIRTVLTQAFTRAGCKVHATASLATLMRWVAEGRGDLVISDVMMPDGNGLETLPKISELRANLPVIIISAQNTIVTAIKASEALAFDYLPKPFDLPELMRRASVALQTVTPASKTSAVEAFQTDLPLVGHSQKMQDLYRTIAKSMNLDVPMLIDGEPGTGKTMVANALHALSDRADAPKVVLTSGSCNSLHSVETVFKRADHGSVIIKNLADLAPDAQNYLLEYMIQGQSLARIISIAGPGLADKVADGTFRRDLYYRVAGITISIPPLRDRVEDIEVLCQHFITNFAAAQSIEIDTGAITALKQFPWPGNVRQLRNIIQQALVEVVEPLILQPTIDKILKSSRGSPQKSRISADQSLSDTISQHIQRYFDLHGDQLPANGVFQRLLPEFEAPIIEIALNATGGNQAKCAEILGINRNTLRKKITELELVVTRRRKLM